MINNKIKQKLYNLCIEYLDNRLAIEAELIENTKKAASNENKSSAGDKYETTRAMMHIEQEKYSRQLDQTLELKKSLLQLDVNKKFDAVKPGSLVMTDVDNFFFAISADEFEIDEIEYTTLSFLSPLGQAFAEKKVGETVSFRGTDYTITSIL